MPVVSEHILDELSWRGLIAHTTDLDALRRDLDSGPLTLYCGFDPTAPSLQAGNLVPLLGLRRFQQAGHRPIVLAGGATGMIGDPRESSERTLNPLDTVAEWTERIRGQLERFVDFDSSPTGALVENNLNWTGRTSVTEFLRDVGKHFSVNVMLSRETIKRRLEGDGISYTEFSYLLMQSYDFVMLYDRFGCTLQMGGSDQWGNITAGIDLMRKLRGRKAHGLVWPLLQTASGVKFGKTEAGTVWLDPLRTSPFRFYQFWLNTDDRDVVRYLKFFTYMTRDEIDALARATEAHPERREAQRALARAVTALVHGQAHVDRAERAAQVLFSDQIAAATVEDVLMVFEDAPSTELALPAEGMPLAEMLTTVRLAPSRSEAMRLLKSGGVYVNNVRATDERARLTAAEAIGGRVFVLRKGRKDQHLVKVKPALT
jgi:tyrosyl-tRNA synthetase